MHEDDIIGSDGIIELGEKESFTVPASDYNREDDVFELARQRGQLVVPSGRDFLALDIDDCSALGPIEANRRIALVRQSPGDLGSFLGKTLQLDSRSGGYHVYIKLNERLTDLERLVWQAALGSDPLKELLSARRLAEGIAPFSVMFESPENYEKVMEFLDSELDDKCVPCAEGHPQEECPKSRRSCGHHCNHIWSDCLCCWCRFEEEPLDIKDYDYPALDVF